MIRPPRRRTTVLLATAGAAALALAGLTVLPAHAEVTEHIVNGTFDTNTSPWWGTSNTTVSAVDGRLCAAVPAGATNPWDASIGQNGIPLVKGDSYTLKFTATASAPTTVKANVQLNVDPYTAALSRDVALTAEAQTFTYTFTSNLDAASGTFTVQLGGAAAAWTFCMDDVSLTGDHSGDGGNGGDNGSGAPEQIINGGFDDGFGSWYSYSTGTPSIVDGKACTVVPTGLANAWDAGLGQSDLPIVEGKEYTLSFEASATPPKTGVRVNVQLQDTPYTAFGGETFELGTLAQKFSFTFTAGSATKRAQVAFQLGGTTEPYTFCVDNVSLRGGDDKQPYVPDTGPRVRVNQVGYLPDGPKNATIVTASTDPVAWQLKNADGDVVKSGEATPRGTDAASGQNVQTVDFSNYTKAGKGYTLVADGETSYKFDISGDVYKQLRSDALQFFYIQRSGIEIDGKLVGDEYARAAGHLDVAPNKGDTDVPCQAGVCDYRLDVRGGWYDAGDHGKYVVNGGIATAQLLSTFERTKTAPTANGGAALGDSTLRLPERGNGVPDILDEARWELEFLMRMQVPAGQPLAGMAHHKIHDQNWTGLALLPSDDPQQRELHPPSTAATLNLAATAAQCARLYAPYDKAFADKCLASAKAAYAAAKANPAVLADPNDGTGGGSYADSNVTDEFYWAAAELYLTTGEQPYLADVTASKFHTGEVFTTNGFGWIDIAALGRLDLATVPSDLPAEEKQQVRASVAAAADKYLATLQAQAYGLPLPGEASNYFWGGNGAILNNVVVLATAFDLTGDQKYRQGALQGVDYIFGRNALNQSYVTGWGEKASKNQHSRMYSREINEAFPNPPAGSLAGGANAGLEDPFAKNLLTGCAPMFCYVDDIQSYATNEVAINWNSALTWAASFLADQGATPTANPTTGAYCKISYVNYGAYQGGFTSGVTITNNSGKRIDGWTLRFAFNGDQKINSSWLAKVTQSGATITAKNESYNARIENGQSVMFGFSGATNGGANPTPGLFTLNGNACS